MKLIVGAPVKGRAWCLPEWMRAIGAALEGTRFEYEIVCLYTESEDDTLQLLEDANVTVLHDDEPGRSVRDIDAHSWGIIETYEYMARIRNDLMAYAIDAGADYFFSLDTDIIIPPGSIKYLLSHNKSHGGVVSPAVNMQINGTSWNTMSWLDNEHPVSAHRPTVTPVAGEADVIMAAMFLDKPAMTQASWCAHSQGEDVGFCLNAYWNDVPLWWDNSVVCQHRMYR